MDQPLSAIVRTAATPDQAKVFVALLRAEGIPAYVDGDSLADEFAMSRRLMNLSSVNVRVPTPSLELAREILTKVDIDQEDLAQQAMTADGAEMTPVLRSAKSAAPTNSRWPIMCTSGAAIVFLGLWIAAVDANAAAKDPRFFYENTPTGLREIRRSDGVMLRSFQDSNANGLWDRVIMYGRDGKVLVSLTDADEDNTYERSVEHRENGITMTWVDNDGDGTFDEGRIDDAQGRRLQTLVWQPNVGLVVQKP